MTATPPAPAHDEKRIAEIRELVADLLPSAVGDAEGHLVRCLDYLLTAFDAHRTEMEDMAIEHDKDLGILLGGLEQARARLDAIRGWHREGHSQPQPYTVFFEADAAIGRIDTLLRPK